MAVQKAAGPAEMSALLAAGRVPVDTDLVLVVENATELRATALASVIGNLFESAGAEGDPRQAWQGLAKELGWPELEAFDKLLGRHLMLVARGIDNPETSQWVLLSQVSVATDQRLKENLKAAPRKIAQGQQMLAIEQGRFELTSHKHIGKGVRALPADREVTVLLAPTGRGQLLDAMLAELVRGNAGPGMLRDEPVHAQAVRMGNPEILLLARLGVRPLGQVVPGELWQDFLVVSANRTIENTGESKWTARVALRERARQKKLLDAGMSSDALFTAMQPASLLTVVQMAPLSTVFGRALPFDDPLTMLPWPARASELFTGKQAIRVHASNAGDEAARTGLVCTLAMETDQGTALARVLDPAIAQFFSEVERAAQQRTDATPPIPDFGGIAPCAARVLTVELGNASPLSGFAGPGLAAAWAFPSTGEGERAWWTLATSAADHGTERAVEAVRDVGRAVRPDGADGGGGGRGVQRRWIWLMAAQPQALEAILAPGVPDFRGIRGLMKRLTELGCRLSITEAGDVEGELTFRLFEGDGR